MPEEIPNQDLPASVKQDYRSLFHTIAGFMAPQPGRLYTVSPRRRVRAAGTASTATAASAFNTCTGLLPLVDTLSPADAVWLEQVVLIFRTNTIAGQATVQSVDTAFVPAAGSFAGVNNFGRWGQVISTPLVLSNTNTASFPFALATPFWSFNDLNQLASLHGSSVGQPWNLGVIVGFLNGAGVSQVVQFDMEAMYRKISSIQEG